MQPATCNATNQQVQLVIFGLYADMHDPEEDSLLLQLADPLVARQRFASRAHARAAAATALRGLFEDGEAMPAAARRKRKRDEGDRGGDAGGGGSGGSGGGGGGAASGGGAMGVQALDASHNAISEIMRTLLWHPRIDQYTHLFLKVRRFSPF